MSDSDTIDVCGSTNTETGEPCSRNASNDDGTCWEDSHTPESVDSGTNHRDARDRALKFNELTAEKIVDAIKKGAPYSIAAKSAGISTSTLYRWRRQFPDFAERIERAEAETAVEYLEDVRQAAAKGNTKAMLWWLEKRYPDIFGHQKGEKGGDDSLDLSRLSDDELEEYIELAEKAAPGDASDEDEDDRKAG